MPSPWFTNNDFHDGPASADYFTSIANIVEDLEEFVTADKDGKATFDLEGALARAFERITTDSAAWTGAAFTNVMLTAPIRPILERLKAGIEKTEGAGTVGPPVDLGPLLADCEVKSRAVTAYFDKLYDGLPDLLTSALSSGALAKNVPPVDDLTKQTMFWRVTFANDWGNESQPSPVSAELQVGLKDTVTIGRPTVPGDRDLTHWRAYRANSGSAQAAFQYVPHPTDDQGIPIATASFEDDVPNDQLEEVCPSTLWEHPPTDLCDVIALDNGSHLGHIGGRTLCPSETYQPHAYPSAYRKTIPEEIVAKMPVDGGAFIGTRGVPYFLLGDSAQTMRAVDCKSEQALVSVRGMCRTPMGPVFVSPDGLCLAAPGQPVKVLTEGHFTREEWQALVPESIVLRYHDGVVHIMRDNAGPAAVAYVWDIAFASSQLTFSGTDGVTMQRNSTTGPNTCISRVKIPKTSGKWEAQFRCNENGTGQQHFFGVCDGGMPPTLASIAENYNYVALRGQAWIGTTYLGSITTDTLNNQVVTVRLDVATRQVQLLRNNVLLLTVTLAAPAGAGFYAYAAIQANTSSKWTLLREHDGTLAYPVAPAYKAWG